ncbi:MAG: cytidyltransferase-related domain protein [Clostridia bacterium]|nr:cytidyltransferase-related domain protein [Clostridia bacterium]
MDMQARYKSLFDTLSGAYAKTAGIPRKLLRAYATKPDFLAALNRIRPESRVRTGEILALCLPVMQTFCEIPEGGWLRYTYEYLSAGLYPYAGMPRPNRAQKRAMGFFLCVLTWFLDAESACPFDPLSDVYTATEAEQARSLIRPQYALFQQKIKETHFRELLRIGRDVMPFDPASHTIGVHHVAVHTARQAALAGLNVDIPMVSAASFSHDIGKFGCRGEDARRVPYLHYYFTWQWLNGNGMPDIAHVAANHSTWDLEFENLPLESLLLIYADFRVRGERDENGVEHVRIYTLDEAGEVILSKLADMTEEKRRRYQTVYRKLRDFEHYLKSHGVNTDPLCDDPLPIEHCDAALLPPAEAVGALRDLVFSNNVRLMRTITESASFEELLEQARNEKNLQRIRTYLRLLEEYSTYMTRGHKLLTLKFLYELLMHHEGDVRRHAGCIMGAILANSGPRYRKELPHAADPGAIAPTLNALLDESTALWDEYVELCLHPDHKISAKHAMRISNSLKTIADSLFSHCQPDEYPQYWQPLYARFAALSDADAFVLTDTLLRVPLAAMTRAELLSLLPKLYAQLDAGEARLRICALRALARFAASDPSLVEDMLQNAALPPDADFASVYLYNRIRRLGAAPLLPLPVFTVSEVYLANLKTSVHWTVKYAHIEWLCEHVRAHPRDAFHVAMHLSNLLSVSEHLPVRERAGEALLQIAPALCVDQCNEIMVDLMRELETGQSEIASYIPPYLGRLVCRMPQREFDEGVDFLEGLLRASNARAARAALSTLCTMLYTYESGDEERLAAVTHRLTGLLLTGVAHFESSIHMTALEVLCRDYFANDQAPLSARRAAFARAGKKLLTLLEEPREGRLVFLNQAAMLNHLYRFLTLCEVEGGLTFPPMPPAAFFPGTFDPFSAGHKRIVEEIRAHGFEVYLAIDEFSWSKRTLPKLLRRQIACMSVAHLWGVYLFPDDIPVNIAVPEDLRRLRALFANRALYLVAGSDVIQNASAYRSKEPGSAADYDHILFSRVDAHQPEAPRRATEILRGKVITLSLPAYYESASSTQIREYIDKDLDIAMLVDPVVQEFIYARGLYLRAPQYKRELQSAAGRLCFEAAHGVYTVRANAPEDAYLRGRSLGVPELYEALGDMRAAEQVRLHTSGRILLLEEAQGDAETLRLLFNDLLARSLEGDHTYALCRCGATVEEALLLQLGFLPIPGVETLYYADMRAPLVLIEDALQRIKEPLKSDPAVLDAIRASRPALRRAIAGLFPGKLLLALDAELLNASLLQKVQSCNDVLGVPPGARQWGRCMCVPYGKILSDAIVPNTVTKTLHADKVFDPAIKGFAITEYPDYSPLSHQVKTLKSFRRPVLLVDDLLHNGYRLEKLDPLFKEEGVEVERIIVGVLSGRGRDLMRAQGRRAECEYFIPNLHYWFTESLLYPFIGGDSVEGKRGRNFLPSINLLLPYVYPKYLHGVRDAAIREFSRVSLLNAHAILSTLEARYQAAFSAVLTLKRLGEALYRPRLPAKGTHLQYDMNVPASVYLADDLLLLERIARKEEP